MGCYGLKASSPPFLANHIAFDAQMNARHKTGGAKEKPESTAARVFLRLAYAIHAAMTSSNGMMGYDQTAMTMVHASALTPESNAMTESPAMRSQGTSDATARIWETIIQMRRPVRLGRGVGDSVIMSPFTLSPPHGDALRRTAFEL